MGVIAKFQIFLVVACEDELVLSLGFVEVDDFLGELGKEFVAGFLVPLLGGGVELLIEDYCEELSPLILLKIII